MDNILQIPFHITPCMNAAKKYPVSVSAIFLSVRSHTNVCMCLCASILLADTLTGQDNKGMLRSYTGHIQWDSAPELIGRTLKCICCCSHTCSMTDCVLSSCYHVHTGQSDWYELRFVCTIQMAHHTNEQINFPCSSGFCCCCFVRCVAPRAPKTFLVFIVKRYLSIQRSDSRDDIKQYTLDLYGSVRCESICKLINVQLYWV